MVYFNSSLSPLLKPLSSVFRAESYEKDEFPVEGWPTSFTALRRITIYRLGWCITCTLWGPGQVLLISQMLCSSTTGRSMGSLASSECYQIITARYN